MAEKPGAGTGMVCGQMFEMKEGFALNRLKLLTMSDIPTEEVQWLWYPYLPRGQNYFRAGAGCVADLRTANA